MKISWILGVVFMVVLAGCREKTTSTTRVLKLPEGTEFVQEVCHGSYRCVLVRQWIQVRGKSEKVPRILHLQLADDGQWKTTTIFEQQ